MAKNDIRIDTSLCDHPKTKRLIRKLGYEAFFSIIKLWSLAASLYQKGILKDCDELDIADISGWSGDPAEFCKALIDEKINFLDYDNGVYSIHDWEENQPWVYNSDIRSIAARKSVSKRWESKTNTKRIRNVKETLYESDTPIPLLSSSSPNPNPLPTHTKKEYIEVKEIYHDLCKKLPKVSKISEKRKSAINSLLKEFTLEQITEGIQKAGKSDFLNGDNKANWKASFDWIINKNNMLKIIEGNYDQKGEKCVADINAQNADWEGVPEL